MTPDKQPETLPSMTDESLDRYNDHNLKIQLLIAKRLGIIADIAIAWGIVIPSIAVAIYVIVLLSNNS